MVGGALPFRNDMPGLGDPLSISPCEGEGALRLTSCEGERPKSLPLPLSPFPPRGKVRMGGRTARSQPGWGDPLSISPCEGERP